MFFNRKKYIPYGKQQIDIKDIFEVVKVLKQDFITQGPKVKEFEQKISYKVNSNYAVSTNSATSALHIACKALGLTNGDTVWTSAVTFVASANCARYCGANIDFLDIDCETGLIDINKLDKKLANAKKNNSLPKIIIPVHLGGASCDMDSIFSLSQKYGFKIIEDASHAIGGKYKSFFVGSCQFSSITIFSFHPVKIITTGEGGIATTNDKTLFKKMCTLRSHGITKNPYDFYLKNQGEWYYEQQELGYNYRLTDIHASLGISQLNKLEKIISKRKKIFYRYKKFFNSKDIFMQRIDDDIYSSFHLAILILKNLDENHYKEIFGYLRNSNIGVQLHYLPVHLQPYYRNLGFKENDFPMAERYSKNAISLPIFPTLSKKNQTYIIAKIQECLKHFKI